MTNETGVGRVVVYQPICQFRWYWPDEHDYHLNRVPRKLQQAWVGDDGSVRWDDIPTVDEERERIDALRTSDV